MVHVVALVAELGDIGKHEEAVGEPARHEELAAVLRRQHRALPFSVGGAVRAQVDGHVEHLARHHADELGLRMLYLEVQAAQHALDRGGLVVLHELAVDAARDEVGAFVGFHEVAAFVAVGGDVHHEHALDGGLGEREVAVLDAVSRCHAASYCPCFAYLASTASLAPCHHAGLSRYHAMVALSPSAKSVCFGSHPSSERSFEESMA